MGMVFSRGQKDAMMGILPMEMDAINFVILSLFVGMECGNKVNNAMMETLLLMMAVPIVKPPSSLIFVAMGAHKLDLEKPVMMATLWLEMDAAKLANSSRTISAGTSSPHLSAPYVGMVRLTLARLVTMLTSPMEMDAPTLAKSRITSNVCPFPPHAQPYPLRLFVETV